MVGQRVERVEEDVDRGVFVTGDDVGGRPDQLVAGRFDAVVDRRAAVARALLPRATRRDATLAQIRAAAWAFDNITDEPAALETIQRLCSR